MQALQAIGGGSFLLVSTVLSIRLIVLAIRNRALPELLLGLGFLLAGTLGAVMEAGAGIIGVEQGWDIAAPALGLGKAFGLLGISCNLVFTWWVFRRHERWALALAVVLAAVQLASFFGHASAGTFSSGAVAPAWFWLELVGRVLTPVWLGSESLLYYQRMRRRLDLGLADPVVANRFALWAIASATGTLFLLTSVPPRYLTEGSPWAAVDMVAFALFGIATAGSYWLAFFPTRRYQRWVEGAPSTA